MTDDCPNSQQHCLNEFEATAICGNDITSSCLYVSALTILQAGKWAPLALLIVAAVLFLYRKIYAEVVGALPLNGGAYNALLNTTSKKVASLAACLTLLSYMATAVISASEAMHYVHSLWHGLPVIAATIILLAAFMVLTIMGIGESAKVAVVIFIGHIATLLLLLGVGVLFVLRGGPSTLVENLSAPMEISITQASPRRCSSASPRRCSEYPVSRARRTSSRNRPTASSPRPCATCGPR